MIFLVRDTVSGFWVARDLVEQYRLTGYRERAEKFRHVSDISLTVRDIYNALKNRPQKVLLSVVRL